MSATSSLDDSQRQSTHSAMFHSARENFPSVTVQDLDAEDAEADVLASVEEKHKAGVASPSSLIGSGSAHEKEEAELKLYNALSSVSQHSQKSALSASSGGGASPAKRFKEAANRVKHMNMLKSALTSTRQSKSMKSTRNLLLGIQEEEETEAMLNTNVNQEEQDGLIKEDEFKQNPYAGEFDHHLLMAKSSSDDESDTGKKMHSSDHGPLPGNLPPKPFLRTRSAPLSDQDQSTDSLPLHDATAQRLCSSDYIATTADGFLNGSAFGGSTFGSSAFGGSTSTNPHNWHRPKKDSSLHDYKKKHWFPRPVREFCAMVHPYRVARNCHDILEQSFFLWIGFPCLLTSWCLFYLLGDPEWEFLPGSATLAWWFLFATRQTVTLGLARLMVYVFVDGFMLGTRLAVQKLGPLLTLIAATSKGWPLILACWGGWNLVLLHGDTSFKRNWLYWTQLEFFNQHYDGLMLNSNLYTRVLISAIMCGITVSAKRTIMALRFGRKQFKEFKPRLERILADVVLLSEIATLAEQADQVEQEEIEPASSWDLVSSNRKQKKTNLKDYLMTEDVTGSASGESMSISNNTSATTEISSSPDKTKKNATFANNTMGEYGKPCISPKLDRHSSAGGGRRGGGCISPRFLTKSDSGRLKIKDMLDNWEEPDSKGDKGDGISIHDILKFRRALSHLDEAALFGEAFGPTTTRDECIASCHEVYYRLLKLAPPSDCSFKTAESGSSDCSSVLPFDVLALLTLQDDGKTENAAKKRVIRKIFTPDRSGALPLLAFVIAVDKIYKRLRYFRASIRNASVIDEVLKKVVNTVFYCVLAFMLSSLMQFNPWTLMVSITSLLVSVSFALGSSISHYVEGVLLIAVRRPYDLGDRIFMASAESLNPMPDVTDHSWFVEDITLTTTTLRYTRTNEVSTVNNWSIASSRIVNCARSPRATVHMEFTAHTSILEQKKLRTFQSEIKRYIEEHPRVWESLAHIRHDHFDADQEKIDFAVAIRHRSSWQEAGRIRLDRSNFYRFLFELGNRLDVHFSSPPDQKISYVAGKLKRGDNDSEDCRYMRDLVRAANLIPNPTT